MPKLGWILLSALFLASPAKAGLFGGDSPPARIPVPAEAYKASITDQTGTKVDLNRFTFNGEVFVYGDLGAGQATILFKRIKEVTFKPSKIEDHVTAVATLSDQSTLALEVESETLCYGETPFGNYQIEVKDLRSIQIESVQ